MARQSLDRISKGSQELGPAAVGVKAAYLGIDIGGTASRWVAVDSEGNVLARGASAGATGHLFNPAERDRLTKTLSSIAGAVRKYAPIGASLGITGLGQPVYVEARQLIGELFNIPPEQISLTNDMELAFRAVFPPGTGHLVSAGTGSIGLHITASGELIRVGGRGLLIDDAGSGTWIALTALDQLYRRIDETGGPAEAAILATELYQEMGGESWDNTRSFIYGSDRGRIGTLAQAVARAATLGDPLAKNILQRASLELARLAKALVARTRPLPIAFVGGITTLHDSMKPAVQAALPELDVRFPQSDAALHAAHWAIQTHRNIEPTP